MEKQFTARIDDLYRRLEEKNICTHTNFLDPAQRAMAKQYLKAMPACRFFTHGGYSGSERQMLFLLPDYLEEDYFPLEDYFIAYKITCPFGSPTHRDYLGSLMGLGIKRECIGDILVADGHALLIIDTKVSSFVETNLTKVARFGVSLTRIPFEEIKAIEESYKTVSCTVASPRLDAITAVAFGISRTAALEAIQGGDISLNWLLCENTSHLLIEGDMISFRGKGRAKLAVCGGTSKKGRQFLELHVYAKRK